MPNINDLFPSKHLKAFDLQGHEPVVTIARVVVEPMGRTRELTPVVYFKGKAKGLRLNKTNATAIQAIAGSDNTDRWVGLAVTLYATTADFGGQAYDVVRIKACTPRQAPTAPNVPIVRPPQPPPVDAHGHDILDSEIPF